MKPICGIIVIILCIKMKMINIQKQLLVMRASARRPPKQDKALSGETLI